MMCDAVSVPGVCVSEWGDKMWHTPKAIQTNKQQNTQLAPQRKGLFHPFLDASSTVPIQSRASSLPANQNVAVFVLWCRVFDSCREGMRLSRHMSENTNTAVLRNPHPPTAVADDNHHHLPALFTWLEKEEVGRWRGDNSSLKTPSSPRRREGGHGDDGEKGVGWGRRQEKESRDERVRECDVEAGS